MIYLLILYIFIVKYRMITIYEYSDIIESVKHEVTNKNNLKYNENNIKYIVLLHCVHYSNLLSR